MAVINLEVFIDLSSNLRHTCQLWFVHRADAGPHPRRVDNRREGCREWRRRPKCQLPFHTALSLILLVRDSRVCRRNQTTPAVRLALRWPNQSRPTSQQHPLPYSLGGDSRVSDLCERHHSDDSDSPTRGSVECSARHRLPSRTHAPRYPRKVHRQWHCKWERGNMRLVLTMRRHSSQQQRLEVCWVCIPRETRELLSSSSLSELFSFSPSCVLCHVIFNEWKKKFLVFFMQNVEHHVTQPSLHFHPPPFQFHQSFIFSRRKYKNEIEARMKRRRKHSEKKRRRKASPSALHLLASLRRYE